jgi:hypothetical protein
LVVFIAAVGVTACGAPTDGDAIKLGPGTFAGTVVADGQLGAGFMAPLEEDAQRGIKRHRGSSTLCLFRIEKGRVGGGGCGGYDKQASIEDEGCGDTAVFGIAPPGGRAVVRFADGEAQNARLYRPPSKMPIGRSFFFASRTGVHTVESVTVFSATGERLWSHKEGADDVTVTCGK